MKRFALLALALAPACTTTDSDNILVSGMYASIRAQADGTGSTELTATLYLGQPIDLVFIELHGGDRLIAHHADQAKVMAEQTILGTVSHHTTFAGDADNSEYEVELQRSVDRGAPSSIVTLPPRFTLDAVATTSRAAPLTMTWAPSAGTDPMRWQAAGSCIESAGGMIAGGDPGAVTIPGSTLRKQMGAQIADSCQVTLTVSRARDGDLDLNYGKGGDISGVQVRSRTFTSMP
jgi:hypothetical protein